MSCKEYWTGGPLSQEDYQKLKTVIKRTCKYISDDNALTNMPGYLNALEEVLRPVSDLECYPVKYILEAIAQMRKFNETRNELLNMCAEFLEALDICMNHPFGGES